MRPQPEGLAAEGAAPPEQVKVKSSNRWENDIREPQVKNNRVRASAEGTAPNANGKEPEKGR